MNCYGEESLCCYLHPKEVIVGVCAPCLKDRLLILAAKQGSHIHLPNDSHSSLTILRRKPSITFPRVFALGSFLHRLEILPQRPDRVDSDEGSIASLEDSFISIKFEDDGHAMWDKKQAAVKSSESIGGHGGDCGHEGQANGIKGGRSLVEHAKPRGPLRWRKRIAHLLHLSRWKRSSKAGAGHVGLAAKVEGAKGRRGWIRSLTRRRTASTTD